MTGELEISAKEIRFCEWLIPVEEIDEAIFDSSKSIRSRMQHFGVQCRDIKYLFQLDKLIDPPYLFPFKVQVNERRSYLGMFISFVVAAYVVVQAWLLFRG